MPGDCKGAENSGIILAVFGRGLLFDLFKGNHFNG